MWIQSCRIGRQFCPSAKEKKKMTIKEYLIKKIDHSKNWKSNNLAGSLYFVYANVQIDLLESVLKDVEQTSLIDMEMG